MPGPLSHSPASILRRALVDAGQGADPPAGPWPIYAAAEPDRPDNCLTVYDTLGADHGRTMPDAEKQLDHGVQVRVRASDHAQGYAKANAVALALDAFDLRLVTVGTTSYRLHAVVGRGDVLALGTQTPTSKRHLFTINARVSVRLAT